jgi:hypothetical protein
MKRTLSFTLFALAVALAAFPYADTAISQANAGWITLFDGSNLDNWNQIGNANWRLTDGIVQADKGSGYLVSKNSYTDFQVRAEFWVDEDANSGVFLRCSNPQNVTSANAYEVNIYDKNHDFGTGAIVDIAKPSADIKAAGHWNTYEITAQGPHLAVVLNGTQTIDMQDARHTSGSIALQYSAGVVKFRKVQIKPL